MKIEEHIFRGIEAFNRGEQEHALLHACLAIDGSAQKRDKSSRSSENLYTQFIRDYYWILEPMTGAGINFDKTQWNNITIKDNKDRLVKNLDMANVIYHIFRCTQAHGSEIPSEYKLVRKDAQSPLAYHIANNRLHIPETIVWGLISICVFAKVNEDIISDTDHFLTLGDNKFSIADWWGLEESFRPIAKKHNPESNRMVLQGLSFAPTS